MNDSDGLEKGLFPPPLYGHKQRNNVQVNLCVINLFTDMENLLCYSRNTNSDYSI